MLTKLVTISTVAAFAVSGFVAPALADTTTTATDFAQTDEFCGDGTHAVPAYETLEVVGDSGTFPGDCIVTVNEESELRFSGATLNGNVDFEIHDNGIAKVEYWNTTIDTQRFGNFIFNHNSSTECTDSSITVSNRNLGVHSGANTELSGCSLTATASNVFVSAGRNRADSKLAIQSSETYGSSFSASGFNAVNARGPGGGFGPVSDADIEIEGATFIDNDITAIKSTDGEIEIKNSDFTDSNNVVVDTSGDCETEDNTGTVACP